MPNDKLECLLNKLKEIDSEIQVVVNGQHDITVKSEKQDIDVSLNLDIEEELDDLERQIYNIITLNKIRLAFKNIAPDVRTYDYGDCIVLKSKQWDKEISFYFVEGEQSYDRILDFVNSLLEYSYVSCRLCYRTDYIEYIVAYKNWRYQYLKYSISGTEQSQRSISYEVSPISKELSTLIRLNESYDDVDDDYADVSIEENLVTLKVRNINSVTKISISDSEFLGKIVKSILFDISRKYGVDINLKSFQCPIDVSDKVNGLDSDLVEKKCIIKNRYDDDLIDYYYSATEMDISEFQYMAYFRVIECIFDEVYKHETIQDIKYIINSDSFSTYDDKDITSIVDIVEKYQKQKNDKEKIKLVFEKYLKGTVHYEAFLLANKEIIKILKDDLKLIRNEEEFKDYQKIGNIVYEFRCKCTHSNRAFKSKGVFVGEENELEKYISLIKKICQRIIVNYSIDKI